MNDSGSATVRAPAGRTWSVRRATVSDAQALALLAADTFALACPPGFDRDAIARHIRQWLSADAFRINLADVDLEYVVASDTFDRPIGYLMLCLGPSAPVVPGPRLLEVRQIYTRTEYHGSGLADDLMQLAIARASTLGLAGLYLGTSKLNRRAIAFYQRHGFRITAERVFLVADQPNDDWILVRQD